MTPRMVWDIPKMSPQFQQDRPIDLEIEDEVHLKLYSSELHCVRDRFHVWLDKGEAVWIGTSTRCAEIQFL